MGNPTGFTEISRNLPPDRLPAERIQDWRDFHGHSAETDLKAQASRCMDCGTPFCHTGAGRADTRQTLGCPLNNLIPEWNDLVYKGLWDEALRRLHKTNNFPEFTGKVCPAPCESACVLAINEPAVTIKNTEWAIIERGFNDGLVRANPPTSRTGKKVTVVGSGPAGLACADQLNQAGHDVTVYERADRIGGLLMYGIPNMKLEKSLVDRRVQLMTKEGVNFCTGVEVGRNLSGEQVREQSDAVVLCCGATNPRDITIPGRDLHGVHQAMDYLTVNTKWLLNGEVGRPSIDAAGKNVLVIGGGDTGTDCVGTALRQGCSSMSQIEIVSKFPSSLPWPQFGRTSIPDYGHEEATVAFGNDPRRYSVTAHRFAGNKDGQVQEAHLIDVNWVQGIPNNVAGTEQIMAADLILLSMGFLGPEKTLLDELNINQDSRSNIAAEYGEFITNVEGVFAAGDVRRGASLVVWAIMEGRGAARACDEYLMGSAATA